MSNERLDINDDEIRIISARPAEALPPRRNKRPPLWPWLVAAVILILVVIIAVYNRSHQMPQAARELVVEKVVEPAAAVEVAETAAPKEKAYVTVTDTVAGMHALRILTPVGAMPTLELGARTLADSTAVLIVQAADVRADNGKIAGAFVLRGDLMSRGEAKAGFCAIIKGNPTIGVANVTPKLEEAIESEGYFFRQYPLVVGGQIIENKLRNRALRKALAEMDGRVCVVLSKERLTLHDFSQALLDAGVQNAIYLVGSSAAGLYVDADGTKFMFGKESTVPAENVNYMVWR